MSRRSGLQSYIRALSLNQSAWVRELVFGIEAKVHSLNSATTGA